MSYCKQCNKKFHYCSSCSFEQCYDNGFCSYQCMVNSNEYQEIIDNVKMLLNSLEYPQLRMLRKLFDDFTDYENQLDEILENEFKSLNIQK